MGTSEGVKDGPQSGKLHSAVLTLIPNRRFLSHDYQAQGTPSHMLGKTSSPEDAHRHGVCHMNVKWLLLMTYCPCHTSHRWALSSGTVSLVPVSDFPKEAIGAGWSVSQSAGWCSPPVRSHTKELVVGHTSSDGVLSSRCPLTLTQGGCGRLLICAVFYTSKAGWPTVL